MLVVSNTSPLSNLAIIGRIDLLHEQFGIVTIPLGVEAELNRLPNAEARALLTEAIRTEWLRVTPLVGAVPDDLALSLDIGEAEALALALESRATIVLLDESAARLKAHQLGFPVTGVLGVLRRARLTGRIPSLKVEIPRLRTDARFFIAAALEKRLLSSVGEA
jgi:predicted nucleic acid-binding protein